MKLTRLRLIGFKSFVEPTDFLIEPGLTGVVGPNGCGKSNLVEALRWVMGESSYKSMRASSMDDVIFSGTNNRPARNNAEVAISIDNAERSAPSHSTIRTLIDIARRIEREAGSTYRINGREVRARDVQILFADASTGARSPALVHQGRIGEIIQAKPEQRRRVLEEAAGVAGLHARRHEAELRLKAAETNLLRVEDVIGQLAAQIDGLKKQARQAIRYRTVSAQVRKSEATLYHLRWAAATGEVDRSRARQGCLRARGRRPRVGAEAEAAKRQALASAALPELARGRGARRRRVAPAQRRARRTSTARKPAPKTASPNSTCGWCSSPPTASARSSSPPTPKRRWRGLPPRKTPSATKRAKAPAAAAASMPSVAEADGELAAAEKIFSELTTALADLTAQRNQFENAAREHGERIARIAGEIAADRSANWPRSRAPTMPPLAAAVEGAQAALDRSGSRRGRRRGRA